MNSTQDINIREIVLPTILSMVLFSAAIFLPPLGLLLSIFCPIPIIFAYLYKGQKTGLMILIAVTMMLVLLINVQLSLVFFVEYGLVAIVMAESIRRNYSISLLMLFSVGASLLLGGTLIYLLILSNDIDINSLMTEQMKKSITSSINIYREMGASSDEIDAIELYSDKLVSAFIRSIPAWMAISSSVGVLLNYLLVRAIWKKQIGDDDYFEGKSLEKWSANEHLIWLLIGSGMLLLLPAESLNTFGLNLMIVSLMIYFYQGIAIILHYMRKKTFPLFLKVIICGLIIIQPLLLLFVILLGIFNIWVDFRKLKDQDNDQSDFTSQE